MQNDIAPDTLWLIMARWNGVREEKECCLKMHEVIEKFNLDGQFRWIVAQKNRVRNGELYRYIAGVYCTCHLAGCSGTCNALA